MSLVHSMSKEQSTIETYVFGADCFALKYVMEALDSIHYKLQLMGEPLSGSSYLYGDNTSVTT